MERVPIMILKCGSVTQRQQETAGNYPHPECSLGRGVGVGLLDHVTTERANS